MLSATHWVVTRDCTPPPEKAIDADIKDSNKKTEQIPITLTEHFMC
jgi:hypothetical protein